jgi:hypothetical protein
MKWNYDSDITYDYDEDNLGQLRFSKGTSIPGGKLFEFFNKGYSKVSIIEADTSHLFKNISISIFKPIYRNGKYIKMKEY